MSNTSLLTSAIIVIVFVMTQVSSYTESCVGESCFTTPDANELRNFDDAKSWCTHISSALAVVNNSGTQLALTQFLKSSNTSAMMFINTKRSQQSLTNTWYLVNGSTYNGQIAYQGKHEYKLYCHLKVGNYPIVASQPNETNRYICDYEDTSTRCLNSTTSNILYNGRCYVKYENESLTWYQARERCINSGGDLAQFQSDPRNIWAPPFDTSWLDASLVYWIGIRWNDWRWKSPDVGDETISISWSSLKPNNYWYECVCVDPNGIPVWSWTDCNCSDQRQFVCLKIVPTTAATTTTTVTTGSPIATTSEVRSSFNKNSTTNALAIGLGAGLGGGVFIIILVVLVVVLAMLTKKRRRMNKSVKSQHKFENTSSATTPTSELTTSNRSEVYAQVVPATQHPANNKPQNDVIYAQPEFSNNSNSASSGSHLSNVRQGKVKSIVLEESNDFCTNAASVS